MLTAYIEISPDDKNQMLNKIRSVELRDKVNSLIKDMELIALPDAHFKFPVEGQASRATIFSLLAIGILLMIIAYINFINFSISMAPVRLKSFNLRRIFGEHPLFLKFSIAMETVFISVIAFLLSLLFVCFLNNGVVKEFFQADLSPANNIGLFVAFAGGAVIIGFFVGMYPAFYATRFKPAMALSGSFSVSTGSKILKNTLIIIQFVSAIFLLITAGFIKIQHDYMQKQTGNWIEKKENIVLVKNTRYSRNLEVFESELRKHPDILDVTYSSNFTGDDMFVLSGSLEDKPLNYVLWLVSHNFLRFFGIDIVEGRDFREGEQDKLIFNRTFLETNSFDFNNDLFGRHVEVQGLGNPVMAEAIGISKDFNFQTMREPIKPIAFIEKQWGYQYIYVKFIPDKSNNILNYIDDAWQKSGNKPSEVVFLDKRFNNLYDEENNLAKLISIFGLIAIIVAVMGVYGLILFNAKAKRKTIALHKVHGASITEVILMLNRGFLIQFAIAYVIAVPLAYYTVNRWLENFAYKTPIHWWVFVLGGLLVFLITVATVSWQSYKAASANPVEALKGE
jgi:putative ABC transport system permease protein